jgi:ketosteroid isomerase-like protein
VILPGFGFAVRAGVTAEETIAGLERQLAAAVAKCDAEGCDALLGEDFTAVDAFEGEQLSIMLRNDWVRARSSCDTRSLTVDDIAVSLHGDFAIATVLWTENGGASSTQSLVTDVWRQTATQEWKLTERHAGRPGVRS